MKEVVALLIFVALLFFGWNQSYKEHYARIFPKSAVAKQRAVQAAQRKAIDRAARNALPSTQESPWMWSATRLDGNRAEQGAFKPTAENR
jgi:hypothetical protein